MAQKVKNGNSEHTNKKYSILAVAAEYREENIEERGVKVLRL